MEIKELAEIVLLNLPDTGVDTTYLELLRKYVAESEIAHFTTIIDTIHEYYKENGIFPSREYIKENWSDEEINNAKLLPEYPSELISRLRTQIAYNRVQELFEKENVSQFKIMEEVKKVVAEFEPDRVNESFNEDNLDDELESDYEKVSKRSTGILSGLSVDSYTRGFPFGATSVIGALPGCGKTAVGLATTFNALTVQDKKGLYISLEIQAKTIYQKLIARDMYEEGIEIDDQDIIKATLSDEEKKAYFKHLPKFKEKRKGKLSVITEENLPELTKSSLETFLKKKDLEMGGIDYIILDQASLLKYFEGIGKTKDEYSIINSYIRLLTVMSYTFFEKPIAMIILCQIKREAFAKINRRKPLDLSIFAEASELERSANVAVALRLDDELKASNLIEAVLIKNRNGDTCNEYVPNVFIPKHTVIASIGSNDLNQEAIQNSIDFDSEDLFA